MFSLTKKQLYNACIKHKYIALRHRDGSLFGVNCSIIKLKRFDEISKSDKPSNYVGFFPINFQQYITIKAPYLVN